MHLGLQRSLSGAGRHSLGAARPYRGGMGLLGRMRSPDGVWHVEVWEQRGRQQYRLLRGGALVAAGPGLATIQRILRDEGDVGWAELVED
jgi:hypothetical protein